MNERDNRLLVAFDIEIFEFEITWHLVAAKPRTSIIVGIHTNTSTRDLELSVGSKNIFEILRNQFLPFIHPCKFILLVEGIVMSVIIAAVRKGKGLKPEWEEEMK